MADSSAVADNYSGVIQVGILTVSDSCFNQTADDRSGPNLRKLIEEKHVINGLVVAQGIVPDEINQIKSVLLSWSDDRQLDLILTTGGTGFAPRDVTPEATKAVLEKEALGMSVAMLKGSLDITPLAMLSRLVCGTRKGTLILNLPGSTKGSQECLGFVVPAIPHAVDLLRGHKGSVSATHKKLQEKGPEYPAHETKGQTVEEADAHVHVPHTTVKESVRRKKPKNHKHRRHKEQPKLRKLRERKHKKIKAARTVHSETIFDGTSGIQDHNNVCRNDELSQNFVLTRSRHLKRAKATEHVIEKTAQKGCAESLNSQVDVVEVRTNERDYETIQQAALSSGQGVSSEVNCSDQSEEASSVEISKEISVPVDIPVMEDENCNPQCYTVVQSNEDEGEPVTILLQSTEVETGIHTLLNPTQSPSGRDEDKENSVDGSPFPAPSTPDQSSNVSTANSEHADPSVYEFLEKGEEAVDAASATSSENIGSSKKGCKVSRKTLSNSKRDILRAKIHKVQTNEYPIDYVEIGEKFKSYFQAHPAIRGIYLNKGKREVKRHLVVLSRADKAVDKGSWQRGKHVHERNRLDDNFELTEDGKKKREKILKRMYRDEYAVNWYLFCPGHGNCRRKCGGYGSCVEGCKGMSHKQDRHNCSLMVNLKLFVSDLTKWRVHITGCHVPVEAAFSWIPPAPYKERISEDIRDVILSGSEKKASPSQIQKMVNKIITPERGPIAHVTPPSKRQIGRLVSSMKKRRKVKDYNFKEMQSMQQQTIQQTCENSDSQYSDTVHVPQECLSAGVPVPVSQETLYHVNNQNLNMSMTVCAPTANQINQNLIQTQNHHQIMSHDQIQPIMQAVSGINPANPSGVLTSQLIMYESPETPAYYYCSAGPPTAVHVHAMTQHGGGMPLPAGTVAIGHSGNTTPQPSQTPVMYPMQTSNMEIVVPGDNSNMQHLQDVQVAGIGDLNTLIVAAYQQSGQ